MLDVIIEAIIDSLKALPFLFVAYLLIEFIEHKAKSKFTNALAKSGKYGSFIGAALGAVPQCGFSVMASNLYAGRVITLGTLIAVFISTSDEAIPILATKPDNFGIIMLIIAIKVVSAIIVGLIIDLFIKPKSEDKEAADLCLKCHCHEKGGRVIVPALIHTVKIFAFILIITTALNIIMFLIGDEKIAFILGSNRFIQPFICAIIGFIPNCAASVLLTDLFLNGVVSFAGLTAGLCTGAGVGLAVLFKANKGLKQNFKIIGILYISGVIIGLIAGIFVH